MHHIYKILFLVVIAVTTKTSAAAQVHADSSGRITGLPGSTSVSDTVPSIQNADSGRATANDTLPVSVNVDLENIFNAKSPKEYIISAIKVTGTKSFDPNLIISISGLAVGDKVMIPGGDNFS